MFDKNYESLKVIFLNSLKKYRDKKKAAISCRLIYIRYPYLFRN